MNKVLIIAPHPDDETLGCGGTILKHKSKGDEVYWLILTNISDSDGYTIEQVQKRQKEIDRVADAYEFSSVHKLDLLTTKLDTIPMSDLIGKISDIINKIEPNIVYVNFYNDIHTDHQVAFKAVMSCTKSFRYPFIKRILMYETQSETEFAPSLSNHVFMPNVFIDISEYFDAKLEIFQVYTSELMEPPFPRSIETITSLAKLRGSRIGKQYAEAHLLLFEKVI